MQYIAIKQKEQNGEIVFVVNAIPLKNKNQSVVQKIPHPLGSDMLSYKTLDEAKEAISLAGFSYILPDGKKEVKVEQVKKHSKSANDVDKLIYEAVKAKINSSNSNVCAAAVSAICEFPTEETFNILFEKIGEENDSIRKSAISGICRYGRMLTDRIIDACQASNWIVKNSAISCISQLAESDNIEFEKFISPLISLCDDANPIVQANAIATLALIYQVSKPKK